MKRNMDEWINEIRNEKVKKAMPVLSFPAITLLNIDVKELLYNSELQVNCMKTIAEKCKTSATLGFMDLSVEAEVFGAQIRFSKDEVPTVIGRLIDTKEDAKALKIPKVYEGRTNIYINAVKKAVLEITDRPVFGGCIGPFSLAGRLMEMAETMIKCYTEPETVKIVLEKVSEFLISYINEYKKAGANGIVMAEPAAGILGPDLNDEFSTYYIKKIIDAVQDENFIVIYHNCGNTIPLIKSILTNGAKILHFGNNIDIYEMLKLVPNDKLVCGNIDPANEFKNGTPSSVFKKTTKILNQCGQFNNFVISSGCDIPPLSPWENINSFFEAVDYYYYKIYFDLNKKTTYYIQMPQLLGLEKSS